MPYFVSHEYIVEKFEVTEEKCTKPYLLLSVLVQMDQINLAFHEVIWLSFLFQVVDCCLNILSII